MHISVDRIEVERNGKVIFSELSFKLKEKQLLYITGPNGSGKSTLLRTISGLIKPTIGKIEIIPDHPRPYVYSGHQDSLKNELTVEQSIMFWSKVYNYVLHSDAIINKMGLTDVRHVPIRALSAGWRKRVGISRLALSSSPIWLLDEPYASLDNKNIVFIEDLIEQHIQNNGLALIATHQLGSLCPTQNIEMQDYGFTI